MSTATTPAGPRELWRDTERCYQAAKSRDPRFDGQFIIAVRSTGIYCRPSCPALTPKPGNVRFYPTSAAAQAGGFRACRRCLPDAVPGSPEWNIRADVSARAMRLIGDGIVDRAGVPGLAGMLGYSQRQLGRLLVAELGAGPLALARAHRAHSARMLIEMSDMPLTDVAFAAGFSSVRQFNDTIREVFAAPPSALRSKATPARRRADPDTAHPHNGPGARLSLRLPLRAPFDAEGALGFLGSRAVPGVEQLAEDGTYRRTLRLAYGTGIATLLPHAEWVHCGLRLADVRDLGSAVARLRRLLDLDADPKAIDETLTADPALAPVVRQRPGVRVPGAVDESEIVLRAMLGQQVSVAAARTAAGKLAAALGERLDPADDVPGLLWPTPASVAEHGAAVLRGPRRRTESIRAVAEMLATGDIDVHVGRDPAELRAELLAAPGVGPWTADYVLMRALAAPDVLLDGDLALRKGAAATGLPSEPAALRARGQAWRPWRSYAAMHLWRAGSGR